MKSKMKNLFSGVRKIAALGVVCMLLFAVVSCDAVREQAATDEVEEMEKEVGGNVCPCDKEMVLWEKQHFPRGEVWLFKNYVPSEFFCPEYTDVALGAFIMYNSEHNEAFLHLPPSYISIMGQGLICNFPDFAKEWFNHENGLRVYIEGVMYYYTFPHWTVVTPFGYMLTSIKKK